MRIKPLHECALAAGTGTTTIEWLERRALLSAAGELDQLFGVGGKVTTELTASSWDGADAVALQPDGKVLVGGRSSAGGAFVLRYLPDGSPDPAFGDGGKAELGHDRTVADLALDSLGRIIVGGSFHDDPDDKQFAVTRLTPSGSPDASFDGDGLAIKAFTAGDDEINALAIDAQDRILAVGSAGSQLAYVRFDADGVPDAQFLRYAMPITGAAAQRIALQPDGKAVIAGSSPLGHLVVLRLNPQGTLDDSFGTRGVATTTIPAVSGARSLIVQEDGRIIVGADVTYEAGDFAIARFLADGQVDTSFDVDGKVSTSFGDGVASRVRSVLLLPGGKILAVGEADHPEFAVQLAAALYHADGTPDLSFGQGSGRMMRAHPSNIPFVVADALLQPGGQVLVAGATYTQMTDMDVLLARYAMTFDADASFGDGGHVRTDFQGPVVTRARRAALGPDGSVVVTGVSLDAVAVVVAKYRPDGTPDTEFGGTGIVRTGFGRSFFGADVASVVAVQDDGKIVVAGHSFGNTIWGIDRPQLALARYRPDGALDSSFGDGGLVLTDATGGYGVASIAIQPDGKIIVGSVADYGTEDADIAILRFNGDGSPDESFGTGGMARVDYGGYEDGFGSLTLQPDGKIVVAGSYWMSRTDAATLTRLLPDGSLDPAFGSGGRVSVDFSDDQYAGDQFFDVGLYRNGDILAAASSGSDVILTRYGAADGLVDDSFGVGGRMTVPLTPGVSITRVLLQPDGKLFLAGRIGASADGRSGGDFFATRLNPDGTTDTAFADDGHATIDFSAGSDTLADALLLPTGGVVMAGSTRDTRDTDFALAKLVDDAFVTGTDGDDAIFAREVYLRDVAGPRLQVWVNADPQQASPTHELPVASIDGLHIDALAGNDVVTLETSGMFPRTSVLGGEGADRLAVTGAGTTAGIEFEGGFHGDTLAVDTAYSALAVFFPIRFAGGDDGDALVVNGTSGGDRYAFGDSSVFAAGNYHITTGMLSSLTVNAGAGDDEVTVDPETAFPPVTVAGGDGNDRFDVTVASSATVRVPRFQVNGGAGDDRLTARLTPIAIGAIPRHAYDGGEGSDGFTFVGSDLNDSVRLLINAGVPYVEGNGQRIDLVNVEPTLYQTGLGNDLVQVSNPPLPVHVDTGDGDDTLRYIGGTDEPITFDLASVQDFDDRDTLELIRGDFTFADDLSDTSPHLTVRTDTFAQVTFEKSQAFAALEVSDGSTVTLASGGDKTLTLRSLSLAPKGTLDLVDNGLTVLAYDAWETALALIEQWVGRARNGSGLGIWRGVGITSSAARSEPRKGLAVWANDMIDAPFVPIMVKYTWNGDASLDGRINADDYFRIDQGFLAQPADPTYRQGDFNYDGRINADDYYLIDQAFLAASGVAPSLPSSASSGRTSSVTPGALSFRIDPDHRPFNAARRIRPVRRLR